MKSAITSLAALVGAVLLALSPAGADLPDKITIATEGAYAPFNYLDERGEVQGFEIDLAAAMCERIGVACEFVVQDWDGIIPGLLAQKYDAIIASLYITDERRERIAFSEKYYQVPARFALPASSDWRLPRKAWRARSSARNGPPASNASSATSSRARPPGLRDDGRGLSRSSSGRVDTILGDVVALSEGFLKTPDGQGFEFRGPEFTGTEWFGYGAGVGVRKDDQQIADAFTKAINEIREDGTYQQIADVVRLRRLRGMTAPPCSRTLAVIWAR